MAFLDGIERQVLDLQSIWASHSSVQGLNQRLRSELRSFAKDGGYAFQVSEFSFQAARLTKTSARQCRQYLHPQTRHRFIALEHRNRISTGFGIALTLI